MRITEQSDIDRYRTLLHHLDVADAAASLHGGDKGKFLELEKEVNELNAKIRASATPVLEIPMDMSEAERFELEERVYPIDIFGEDADYYVWAASTQTTWDVADQLGDDENERSRIRNELGYHPVSIKSPGWTGTDRNKVAEAVANWRRNYDKPEDEDLILWAHLGRGWMPIAAHKEDFRWCRDVETIYAFSGGAFKLLEGTQ